jgi:hypothetical protein
LVFDSAYRWATIEAPSGIGKKYFPVTAPCDVPDMNFQEVEFTVNSALSGNASKLEPLIKVGL